MLDKHQTLVRDAQLALCILGNPQTSDFELIEMPKLPLSEERLHSLRLRGMYYLGVVGLVDGVPRTALDEPLENAAVDALARAFLSHMASLLRSASVRSADASVQWLAELYSLTDPRHEA